MSFLLLLVLAAPAFADSCQSVDGASITASDFAPQVPAFSTLPPETPILAAPFAGVERVVSAAELSRLTRKLNLNLDGPAASLCFELATAPLTADDLLPVFKAAFPAKELKIEILEFTSMRVPRGTLQFTRGGLEPSGLWHGRVVYAEGRSMNVWARVRLLEERTWVEASELLPAGKPIRADQLVLQTGLRSPLDPPAAESLESVVGRKPLRMFAPGAALRPQFLIEPPQVERGDKVSVQVASGGALLQFDAEAESPGHLGDLVFLRNPENGHRFQAKVEGKGKVAIRK
jgi:flagella basal body P-ring formation protein FlgA